MFWIIVTSLSLLVIAGALLIGWNHGGKSIAALVAVGLILFTAFCSFTTVQTRSVGIATSFNKPVETYSNGFHLKAPWWRVTDLDGAIQNNIYNGDNQIEVRLASNAQARVDVSIQWQLKQEETLDLFLNFRSIESIQSNIIDRNLRSSVNEVMSGYNPLDYSDPAAGGEDLASYQDAVLEKMREKVGDKVDIHSVTLPIISFDEATQARIDELQSEIAKTRIAEQSEKTAEAEARANSKLEESVSQETLTSKCLDIVRETGGPVYGCFPGSDVTPIKDVDSTNK